MSHFARKNLFYLSAYISIVPSRLVNGLGPHLYHVGASLRNRADPAKSRGIKRSPEHDLSIVHINPGSLNHSDISVCFCGYSLFTRGGTMYFRTLYTHIIAKSVQLLLGSSMWGYLVRVNPYLQATRILDVSAPDTIRYLYIINTNF